jgi:hypothetical protein
MLQRGLYVILRAVAVLAIGAKSETTECSRHDLETATSRYVATLSTGQLGWLNTVLADNATYLENLVPMDIANRTVPHPLRVDYRRTTVDTTQCATYTELLVTDPSSPWMIATQLRFDNGRVNQVDSIVTTDGDLLFNATHALHYYLLEDWSALPVEERDAREVLQAAADAYFDVFVDKTVVVPWGTPCARIEGGFLDANGTCDTGIPDITVETKDRRYVIDETVGSVDIISNFGILGPDSHEFRIIKGEIRAVHSMTLCRPNDDCGLAIPDLLTQDIGF